MALTKVGKEGITGISNASDATADYNYSQEHVGIGPSPRFYIRTHQRAANGITIQNASASGTADSYVQFQNNTT